MNEKSTEQMYLEDTIEAVEKILSAPLPMITASRERDRAERMALALEVIRGDVHPGDMLMAPLASIDEQVAHATSGN